MFIHIQIEPGESPLRRAMQRVAEEETKKRGNEDERAEWSTHATHSHRRRSNYVTLENNPEARRLQCENYFHCVLLRS